MIPGPTCSQRKLTGSNSKPRALNAGPVGKSEMEDPSTYISARLDSLTWPVMTSSSRSRGRSCEHSPRTMG